MAKHFFSVGPLNLRWSKSTQGYKGKKNVSSFCLLLNEEQEIETCIKYVQSSLKCCSAICGHRMKCQKETKAEIGRSKKDN